jgi:hypothetical protein
MATREAPAPWARGDLTFYRLYDVAYEIDLGGASRALAANAPERPRPVRGEAQAIQIPNPPVTVRLGNESIVVAGAGQSVEFSARIFDFGEVVSVRGGSRGVAALLGGLTRQGVLAGAGPEWGACFQRWRDQLIERIRPAIERPAAIPAWSRTTASSVSRRWRMAKVDRCRSQRADGRAVASLLFGESPTRRERAARAARHATRTR